MFYDDSSVDGGSQREFERDVLQLGDPEASGGGAAPYSNTRGSNTSWREIRQAGEYAVRAGIDWHEGKMWGRLKDPEAWAQRGRDIRRMAGPELDEVPVRFGDFHGVARVLGHGLSIIRSPNISITCGGSIYFGLWDAEGVQSGIVPALSWQWKGQFCSGKSPERLLGMLRQLGDMFGVVSEAEGREYRMTQLDICQDVLGLEVDEVVRMSDADQVVCRARMNRPMHDGLGTDKKTPTVYFGAKGADTVLKVYDKRKDLNAVGHEEKAKVYWAHNQEFHGVAQGPLTRFEFSEKREPLKKLGMGDARACVRFVLANAVMQRAQDWWRVVERDSATRRERCQTAGWWVAFRSAWAEAFACEDGGEVVPLPEREASLEPIIRQMAGLAAKGVAYPEGGSVQNVLRQVLALMKSEPARYLEKAEAERLKLFAGNKAA